MTLKWCSARWMGCGHCVGADINWNTVLTSFSPYFSHSSFICLKSRVVVPHKLAVFSTRTTLPFRLEKLNWKMWNVINSLRNSRWYNLALLLGVAFGLRILGRWLLKYSIDDSLFKQADKFCWPGIFLWPGLSLLFVQ